MARRHTPTERAAHVRAYLDSDLTQRDYAAQIGVTRETLRRWLRQQQQHAKPPGFVELSLPALTPFVLSLPDGLRLEVPPGFNAAELRRLVDTLGC